MGAMPANTVKEKLCGEKEENFYAQFHMNCRGSGREEVASEGCKLSGKK
jgi:hypothetical protein